MTILLLLLLLVQDVRTVIHCEKGNFHYAYIRNLSYVYGERHPCENFCTPSRLHIFTHPVVPLHSQFTYIFKTQRAHILLHVTVLQTANGYVISRLQLFLTHSFLAHVGKTIAIVS